MKEELTELEIAKLQAKKKAIAQLKQKINILMTQLKSEQAKQQNILQQVEERIDPEADVPVEKWDFSAVNWSDFEGEVVIPEEGGEDGSG